MAEKQLPKITGRESLGGGSFLELVRLSYTDDRGRARTWETAERIRSRGAVIIAATFEPEGDVLLVRQFRPPAGRYVIEFPAGLIDPGETPEESAHRELLEETGYTGKILGRYPPAVTSPGLSGESAVLVRMAIDSAAFPTPPEQHLEDTESITCLRVPRAELGEFLLRASRAGDVVDSKLFCLDLL